MPVVKVSIKWGKEKYDNVELNTDEAPDVFQAQVFALTGVPPEKQKLLTKGQTIKAGTDLNTLKLKDGAAFMLMGGAEAVAAPAQPMVFQEDLSSAQLSAVSKFPPGLRNLGNTCYLNATLQAFRGAPELEERVISGPYREAGVARTLSLNLANLYRSMRDGNSDRVDLATGAMLLALRSANPRFGEMANGHPAQQDAGECWGELLRSLSMAMPGPTPSSSLVDQMFGLLFSTVLSNQELPNDTTTGEETALQLSCHIEKDVGYMMSGIKHALQEEKVTKACAQLGRDAVYSKKSLVSRLPAYLVVNFVRFFYKKAEKTNCKIIKDVKFPFMLDVFELCTPALQARLTPARAEFAKYADFLAENQQKTKGRAEGEGAAAAKEEEAKTVTKYHPFSFEDDPLSSNSGMYDLCAVLTHKGRASDSGHYVCWRKHDEKTWLLFDDDDVIPRTREDVEKLSGGGADWHTAYILLYAPRRLPVYQ